MKLNVICNAEYKILMSLSFVCREIYIRASIHIITSLELLGTLISMLEQKKANECISSPFFLKSFFLSEK